MVDEYQDTNTAQAIFVKELASNNNILVVADDDQAIYRFREHRVQILENSRKISQTTNKFSFLKTGGQPPK